MEYYKLYRISIDMINAPMPDINSRVILHYYNQLMTLHLKYYLDLALSSNI